MLYLLSKAGIFLLVDLRNFFSDLGGGGGGAKKNKNKKIIKKLIFFYFLENYGRRVCKSTNKKNSGLMES